MRTLMLVLALATGAVGLGPAAANAFYCVEIFGSCSPVFSGVCEYCDVEGVCVVEGRGGGASWCRATGVVCDGYSDATKTCTPF